MNILDNIKEIKKLDKSNMLGSIDLLPKQIEQAWDEVNQIEVPGDYKNINKIIVHGMGGSGLGTHIIRSLFLKKLKVPFSGVRGYHIPAAVDEQTLYILSSYSGNTEEVIQAYEPVKKRGAKILAITAGGELAELIRQGKIPGYIFNPKYNITDQPRMGIGYSVFGLLGLLKICGLIKISDSQVKSTINYLNKIKSLFAGRNLTADNLAKQAADHLRNTIPIIISAEFLAGNAHIMANQLNENAKNFSAYHIISELNHHLMEGLKFPASNKKNLHILFFESGLYYPRNLERIKITKEILRKNKINYVSYKLQGQTELEQSFEALLFGSYVSFYLAMLNNLNPSPVPWVDYFKNQLK